MQRWNLRLQAYDYTLIQKPGKNNLADPLSRLVKHSSNKVTDYVESYIHYVVTASVPKSLSIEDIVKVAEKDPEMESLRVAIATGIWDKIPVAYSAVQNELCVWNSVILRGDRLVIPASLRQQVLNLAHSGHPGIVNLKARLRSKVWWPSIHTDAERKVKTCQACQAVAKFEPPEPIKRRQLPERPWEQIAFDFMGPLPSGDHLFVLVDLYSRFVEVKITKTTNAKFIIETLQENFARYGLPNIITCDNAPQHHAAEVKVFCEDNGIQLFYSTPYWPQSNGAVERQNRNILKILQTAQIEQKNWKEELHQFLLMHRNTPNAATGKSPAELVFRYSPRDPVPSIKNYVADPEMEDREKLRKFKGQIYANDNRNVRISKFVPGQKVLIQNEAKTNKLSPNYDPIPATVVATKGTEIAVEKDGKTYSRNSAHLKEFLQESQEERASSESGTGEKPLVQEQPIQECSRRRRNIRPPSWQKDYV